MDDMRERLIELLDKVQYHGNATETETSYIQNSTLADYLIKNGVILPMCRVGDILWFPSVKKNKVYSKVIKEISIHEKDGDIEQYVYASYGYFPLEYIGNTVFLSKEEAQKALENEN